MLSPVLLCHLLRVNPNTLANEEVYLLEASLLTGLHEELCKIFKERHKLYFSLLKLSTEEEKNMLETHFIRFLIDDILATREYNLQGIAYYTDTPLEVLRNVYKAQDPNPSANLLRRTIELHRSVKRELYEHLMKKIISAYTKKLKVSTPETTPS